MEYVLALALIAGIFAFFKFKSLFLKAENAKLVKEDQALQKEEARQKQIIEDLKHNLTIKAPDLNPEQVEEFWKDDKK